MWAHVRTPGSGNDNKDVAAWWVQTGFGLAMKPIAKGVLLVYDSLVLDKTLYATLESFCFVFGKVVPLLLYGYVGML